MKTQLKLMVFGGIKMQKQEEKVLIWGAGKIGRGFIADLFSEANYHITFADNSDVLVKKLKANKKYNLFKLLSENESDKVTIKSFDAIHTSEIDNLQCLLDEISLMALVVFPNAFDEVGEALAEGIIKRANNNVNKPLDILVCTNIMHPTAKLKESIVKHLDDDMKVYYEKYIGLAECLVIRMAVQPQKKLIEEDELVVVTNGYPELIVDQTAFKGKLPNIKGLIFTDKIEAEEQRKMFTYNMVHALYSYIGITKGYEFVYECTRDEEVNQIAKYALDEIGQGLIKEFGFSEEDMARWNQRVLKNMANPILKDKLVRVGGDPIRKLKRTDRLTGAALLCRKNGIMPYYLAKAIGYGYLFCNQDDNSSMKIHKYVKMYGLKNAVLEYSQLNQEPDIVQLIFAHYRRAIEGEPLSQNVNVINKIKQAYTSGFNAELKYRGCGQCALIGMFEVLNIEDAGLFQAASGLSGGMALYNDGACGGYNGGILLMGKFVGRKLDRMRIDGDKEDQYRSFTMAQKLHDKFIETYGSVVCKDIHNRIFGEWFCLKEKKDRDRFEDAGAHKDKCTSVIANSCAWITEILIEEGFIKL